ncbi:hypothetical protein ACERK3_01630 [Phycisphaerales bacterium AB-hyl4]|uniref:Heparinase II/III-like protein n=1 Tax=Natronomicrosphaera hydrolytica TaxID=3242702 RepID=A0ABV4U2B7_9BACT
MVHTKLHELKPCIAVLDRWGQRYDPEHGLPGETIASPGYHTTLPDGMRVHSTRTALDYVLLLLTAGEAKHVKRAGDVLRKVLLLQDTDPCSATYGIWPWFLEEPLSQMAPPDWNWADFCGARLAVVLADHADRLPGNVMEATRTALGHAAWSIFRRNVQPSYTNIAVMGGVVAAAAGELLDEPSLVSYGRRRLQQVVAHAEHHGGFAEYNSPTYTMVVLAEVERCLQLVQDAATRDAAETLRQRVWSTIAEHYHPVTGQWAGPHARTYHDTLLTSTVARLRRRVGSSFSTPLATNAENIDGEEVGVQPLPCPPQYLPYFERLSKSDVQRRHRFRQGSEGHERQALIGTTWLHDQVTLASINRDTLWTQCRPLIGYIASSDDFAVTLRVRLLKDGRDWASGLLHTEQNRSHTLSVMTLLQDGGDYHLHLDRPADGTFHFSDLRLRIELHGKGVMVTQLDNSRFTLQTNDWKVVVHAPEGVGQFPCGTTPDWQSHQQVDSAVVDAVLHNGLETALTLNALTEPHWLAFALELLPADAKPATTPIRCEVESGILNARWPRTESLAVKCPVQPERRLP